MSHCPGGWEGQAQGVWGEPTSWRAHGTSQDRGTRTLRPQLLAFPQHLHAPAPPNVSSRFHLSLPRRDAESCPSRGRRASPCQVSLLQRV